MLLSQHCLNIGTSAPCFFALWLYDPYTSAYTCFTSTANSIAYGGRAQDLGSYVTHRHASIVFQNLPTMLSGNSTKFALLCSKIFPLCSRIFPLCHVKPSGESQRNASQATRAT